MSAIDFASVASGRQGTVRRGSNQTDLSRRPDLPLALPRFRLRRPATVATAALILALTGCGQTKSVAVTVAGKHEDVPAGTTLGQMKETLLTGAAAGNLVDVEGRILRARVFPGGLLLNGRRSSSKTALRNGDRVAVLRGRDRREPLRRELVALPQGSPGDPQFELSRLPGNEVIVLGALSGELVSARFHPNGRRPTVERAVALTFDDGPSPADSPRVLAVLRRFHVRATFFVVGYLAERYPQIVALEQRDGMTIGNHTYNHPEVPPFAQLPAHLMRDEIVLGARSLTRIGARPGLLRPPGGSFSPQVIDTARSLGERVVLWSVDPKDWSPGVTAKQVATRVLRAVRPGSIVILHDGGGDRSATVRALPMIIKGIRRRGLRLVEISAS